MIILSQDISFIDIRLSDFFIFRLGVPEEDTFGLRIYLKKSLRMEYVFLKKITFAENRDRVL